MISKKLEAAINDQIRAEFYASYLYLSMAAYCESINLMGFAAWFYLQSDEERGHAMKFYRHLIDRGGTVQLQAIDRPEHSFESMVDVFERTVSHEREVGEHIHNLYTVAVSEKDYPAQVMLQWFVTEQVEEDASASHMLEQLKMVGDSSSGLLLLDRKAGERTGTASTTG